MINDDDNNENDNIKIVLYVIIQYCNVFYIQYLIFTDEYHMI